VVVPEAPVAAMPPSVASAPGSTGKNTPSGRSFSSSARRVTPASTVTSMSAIERRKTRAISRMSTDTPPASGITWPSSDVPAPNGTIGTPRSWHARTIAAASSVERGNTTASGGSGACHDSSLECWRTTSGPVSTRSPPSRSRSASSADPTRSSVTRISFTLLVGRGAAARRGPTARVCRPAGGQLAVMAVSSMTKEVCSETSSTPVNFRVTVCPANDPTLNERCTYPVALFRFE